MDKDRLLERMRAKQGQPLRPTPPPAEPKPATAAPDPKAATPPAPKKKKRVSRPDKEERRMARFRLPPGTRFEAAYDGESARWTGTLTVPGHEPRSLQADGVHRLIFLLGRLYHDHGFTPTPPPL